MYALQCLSIHWNKARCQQASLCSPSCRQLPFEDFWQLFGEGKHPQAERLYEHKLAPFLTQTSHKFWKDRLWYFKQGLYYQGGQVSTSFDLSLSH